MGIRVFEEAGRFPEALRMVPYTAWDREKQIRLAEQRVGPFER